jgi:hypothetical protein
MSFSKCRIVAVGADGEAYHEQQAERGDKEFVMSSSALRSVFVKCPSAWRAGWTLAGSDALEYGSLLDCLVLTPELFAVRYVVQPSTYMADGAKKADPQQEKPWNNNATFCRDWKAAQKEGGLNVISNSELADAQAAVRRLMADEKIKAFIEGSQKQVWIKGEWQDEGTGLIVPVQCLIDLAEKEVPLTRQRIGDLKTTKNAAPLAWARWARFAGYDVQAAWNLDMFNAATNRGIDLFEFVLSESEAPYQTARRVAIDPHTGDPESDEGSAIVSGRRQYRKMMSDYCNCLKSDFWPGYDDTDESSNGATELRADPYEEQRRMFAPKFAFSEEPETPEPDLELSVLN